RRKSSRTEIGVFDIGARRSALRGALEQGEEGMHAETLRVGSSGRARRARSGSEPLHSLRMTGAIWCGVGGHGVRLYEVRETGAPPRGDPFVMLRAGTQP